MVSGVGGGRCAWLGAELGSRAGAPVWALHHNTLLLSSHYPSESAGAVPVPVLGPASPPETLLQPIPAETCASACFKAPRGGIEGSLGERVEVQTG